MKCGWLCDSWQPTLSLLILLQNDGIIHHQRRHHRYLSLPLLFFFLFSVFLLSPHLHSSSVFIFPDWSPAFHSSSPAFFIFCQMISGTDLIPTPLPLLTCQSRPFSWLSAMFFNPTHIPNLTRLGFHHFVFFLLLLLFITFHDFFFPSDLSVVFLLKCLNLNIFPESFTPDLKCITFSKFKLSFIYLFRTDKN